MDPEHKAARQAAASARYRVRHPEKVAASLAEWRAKNVEHLAAYERGRPPRDTSAKRAYDKARRAGGALKAQDRARHATRLAEEPAYRIACADGMRRRKFGLSPEEYARILDAQGRRCATCRVDLCLGKGTHVDHCHTTGLVRGVLCQSCNLALGHAKDDPVVLAAMADYLLRASPSAPADTLASP